MKRILYFIVFITCTAAITAQQAGDYFTVDQYFRWEFISTPLDSSGNEIDNLKYSRWDLFISETVFEGKPAKILQTKSGPTETIAYQPYLDSMIYHFSGADGYEYFKVGIIGNLLPLLDSLISNSTFSVSGFLHSLEQWYSVYRFAQTIGDDYTIFQIDTTITIDNNPIPLRLEYQGERLQDETINTGIGILDCKKFIRSIVLSYLLIPPPPFPPIPIPILSLPDSVWIAEDYWIVQELIPPVPVDLTFINQGTFYIPGLITRLDGIVGVEEEISKADKFTLLQNYPNPFNPATTIRFAISSPGLTTLKIYNSIGEEVAVLIDKELNTGTYEIRWNAGVLPSGIYLYRLQAGNFIETKKMILIK